ncbi:MAG TPA: hypothetical protein PLL71_16565 [Agriterribacter sp.]|nr:hypothetical protein [Agriterribacter sp.]HRQ51042.1 hypothetical protein [Agriterribacter sp.]
MVTGGVPHYLKEIKKAMGIAAVYTEAGSYIQKAGGDTGGVQIDMLIDRADNIINVCDTPYSLHNL